MNEPGFRIDNPYSGETVAERRFLADAEVEGVVARASRAQKAWARTPLADRLALCERFCAAFQAHAARIARGGTPQMGKPLAQARAQVRTALARARTLIATPPPAPAD